MVRLHTEEWRAIPGVVGYEASTLGRIRSTDRVIVDRNGRRRQWRGRILTLSLSSTGYPHANLGSQGQWDAHRLIALTFLGPAPVGMEVCHGDGTRTNNRIDNLRYGTRADNVADAIRHGTHSGAVTHCPQDHPYDKVNTGYGKKGNRVCRACARERARRNHARTQAA